MPDQMHTIPITLTLKFLVNGEPSPKTQTATRAAPGERGHPGA